MFHLIRSSLLSVAVLSLLMAGCGGRATPQPTPANTPLPPTHLPFEPELVFVPAGEFLMGADDSLDNGEKPQHRVYVEAFWIAKTEVTNAQYNACVQAGKCQASVYANDPIYNNDNQPAAGVRWGDAVAYASWLAEVTSNPYRLPTEAEWEKACRGADGWIYPWGNQGATCEYAVMNEGKGNGCGQGDATWPVGSKPKGASPYGALDMSGNVWEWISSSFWSYPYVANDGREDAGSSERGVVRGGSLNFTIDNVRCACREISPPSTRYWTIGFRVGMAAH